VPLPAELALHVHNQRRVVHVSRSAYNRWEQRPDTISTEYGVCGVGAYCLAGCDPLGSFDLNSCMARPVCKSADYKLTSLSDFASYTDYLGDASKTNWVYEGSPAVYQDNSILLTMPVGSAGTLVSSSHYVWYGKISATMRTSAGQGVVTAFILMSDVKVTRVNSRSRSKSRLTLPLGRNRF